MNRAVRCLLWTAAITASALSRASATELTVIRTDQNRLVFDYQQAGVPVEGPVTRLSNQLPFDPAAPTTAEASLDVDLRSVDAGSPEASHELANTLWFDTKTFATARFVAESVTILGEICYELRGKTTIKRHTSSLTTRFTFVPTYDGGLFESAFILKGSNYAVGEGIWTAFGTVANEAQVKSRFVAATMK